MPLNIEHIYNCLQNFNFADLFIKDFGWNPPLKSREIDIDESHVRREIARLAEVPLLEIKTINGEIPDAQVRADLYKKLSALFPKTLLIFIDNACTQSIWYWIKNDGNKPYKREYHYFKGQPGDGFLSKFDSMVKDLGISDEMIAVSELAERLKLPVNQVFYKRFDEQRALFLNSIRGIDEEQDRQWYASILLNRLIFTYFLEKRGFLDGDVSYLEHKLNLSSEVHPDHYYDEFLLTLFFKMFAKYSDISSDNRDVFLGHIPYLNDSLPMPHPIELRYPDIHIPDSAFEELFSFFSSYSWSLVDIPDGKDYEINPHVLSYLFELYIKQKTLASYYIRGEITDYLCKQTIHRLILSRVNRQLMSGISVGRHFDSLEEMLTKLDAPLCHKLLFDILPGLSLLDPACGSGFFLLAALRSLVDIYGVVVSRIQYLEDANLFKWYQEKSVLYPDITYYLKQKVITENLFGVDILEEATEITRLQLLLALFTSIHTSDQIKPLSDINFNISAGNSLIGLLRLEDYPYKDVRPSEALANLDKLLLDQINNPLLKKLNKKARNKQTFEDIKPLKPFHWGYKFGQIMNEHGGFDVIITDPPWKILRSLDQYSNFLRSNPQYEYQGVENLNLYKLFVERCYKLLCDDGQCGILVPSGIVSDYSTQQLREMLFNKTCITSLFTFENRRHILSGVDSRFKFALLTFYKGGSTKTFPASFNRFNVEELTYFPSEGSISIPVTLIRRLSPDICSIAEFRSTIDMQICEKMARYPFLDERMDDRWNVVLTQDIHMTHNHRILHTEPGADYLPLYEGKMIQQFIPQTVQPRYWVKEADGRAAILGHELDKGQRLDYQSYRLGYRTIVGSNDERTLVSAVLPPNVFAGNTLNVTDKNLPAQNLLFLLALLNSFVVDFMIRLHVSAHITMHDVYQLPIPRLTKDDIAFFPIVERATRLICISPDFKDLWNRVMPVPWSLTLAATTFADRVRTRAELDGLIAHLYDLTEEQFTYLLATFPFVPEPVRVTTHNAYRDVERGLIK